MLYVHGNHDASYDREPPRGAICIDDDLYWYKGYRIVGLGGSCRYRAGAWQFTEAEMKRRISHLRSKIQHAGGVDILSYPCAAARLWGFQRPAAPRVYGVQ